MKKFYFSLIMAAAGATGMQGAEPITVDFVPNRMQYMCKPGALPDTDVLVFNITETDFYPDHTTKHPGWTLALEAVGPLSNTQVNEDPGVPVGSYTVGIGWDDKGKYVPFTIRDYSEARHIVDDGTDRYTDCYEISSGTFEIIQEGDRYYISGQFRGKAYSLTDSQEVTVNIAKTEVTPEYTFFGYPEVEDGYELTDPDLLGSYTVRSYRNSAFWGEYNLEFYTTPLDETLTVSGAGAIMRVVLCTEYAEQISPESLAGEYAHKSYLHSIFEPFDLRGGFLMETDLTFGTTQGSRITVCDPHGLPIKSSFADSGVSKVTYLGDMQYRIETELFNQFGDVSRCVWEGPLFEYVKNAPQVAGIDGITADSINAPAEYFDLSGKRIDGDLAPGIYLMRRGDTVTKQIVR